MGARLHRAFVSPDDEARLALLRWWQGHLRTALVAHDVANAVFLLSVSG